MLNDSKIDKRYKTVHKVQILLQIFISEKSYDKYYDAL